MKLLNKFIVGIFFAAAVFVCCNSLYEKIGWQEDIQGIDDKLLRKKLEEDAFKADILYFAESSNASCKETDTIRKSISELINTCFPDLSIKAVEKGAIHAGVYRNLVRLIPTNSKTKTIIVTMNLRSFGAGWIHARLENHCQQLQILYNDYPALYNKMRLVFKMYDYKEDWKRDEDCLKEWHKKLYGPLPLAYESVRKWDKNIYLHPYLNEDGTNNGAKTELAAHNVKSFAFNIDTLDNPRIKDFNEIVKICEEKNIRLYFNLLPENIEYADSLVGKELTSIMKMNRDILVRYYTNKGAIVIDNLEKVRGKNYLDQSWTTEHYSQEGRIAIAKNVAETLRKQYPAYYKQCNY